MQRRRPGHLRHEKAPCLSAQWQGDQLVMPPDEMPYTPSPDAVGAIPAYPLRLLFEHLCVVSNGLEQVIRGEAELATLDALLDALDHMIDRVAESLPPEDQ